jgi:adenylate kinase
MPVLMSKAFDVRRPAILILGPPGSGKGTQGKILGAIPRFFHCACGDIFRSLDTRTAIGQRFVEYSSRGELVPDELTVELWKTRVENWADSHIYKPDIDFLVLDGIPRNVRQAEIIATFLDVHQVFHLTCPNRSELARRMRKRALKENRIDDASDRVIAQRIETYDAETRPLLDHYPRGIITVVDAQRAPVEVLGDIIRRVVELPAYQEMAREVA